MILLAVGDDDDLSVATKYAWQMADEDTSSGGSCYDEILYPIVKAQNRCKGIQEILTAFLLRHFQTTWYMYKSGEGGGGGGAFVIFFV